MVFTNRDEFTGAQASNKVVLAHVQATTRFLTWTLDSGSIYKRSVAHFVVGLNQGTTVLTEASSAAVSEGEWYYDSVAGELYVHTNGSVDPTDEQMVGTYRFFFSNTPAQASYDLSNTGNHVNYDGRIIATPGYKHQIGIEQSLTSTTGSGTLKIENNDAALDEIFDVFFFENQEVSIYSWNRDLDFEQAQIIFKGRVTNKTYETQSISFTIKDSLFDLEQQVPQPVFTSADNVNTNIQGRLKRWVYGRVDGLSMQSVDQIGEGYTITGTGTADAASATLTGTGTLFLSETSPGDRITIGTQEFNIDTVVSDTEITLDDTTTFSFVGQPMVLKPDIPTTSKNREFFVAAHACAELTYQVVNAKQFNRIELSDTTGLREGDFVEFATTERKEIKNVAPGNIIVLRSNVVLLPTVGSDVTRQPIQQMFVEGNKINDADFTISNLGGATNETKVTIAALTEFNIARTESLGVDLSFTNASRSVTSASGKDLRDIISPRDWVRPDNISYSTFYEVLSVDESSLELRVAFADPTINDAAEGRRPNYIGDNTIVSSDVLGKTEDGEPDGTWIKTAAKASQDLLSEINVTNVNAASFTTGAQTSTQLISLAIPLSRTGTVTPVRDIINLLNKTTYSSLTLDEDLKLKYKTLLVDLDPDAREISDEDVISWKVKTTNGKQYRNSIVNYRFTDIDRSTLEAGNLTVDFSNEFVELYIGTDKTLELSLYMYDTDAAETAAHRNIYFNRLGRADVTIVSDLRLEDVEIGDQLILNFDRLYKRFGDATSRKKSVVVVGKTVTGERVSLVCTDLGNTYNSSSIITPNTAPDYDVATEDEKLKYGFITDSNGIVEDDENTSNIHLIN